VATYVARSVAKPGKDTGALATAGVPQGGPPGLQVFAAQGCGSCHTLKAAGSSGTTGPNLDQALKGKSPAYIKQSIVDPNAKIAPGYSPGIMPQVFGQTISAPDLNALVQFLMKYAGKTSGSG
jgi:mono/diheme cytochrome c family protein